MCGVLGDLPGGHHRPAATTALGMVGWGMLVLTPAIVDVMQQQGAYFNARMFRFAPGTAVTGLSALVGVWLVRRG